MNLRIMVWVASTVVLAACASGGGRHGTARGYAGCEDCGRIERIERYHGERRASGSGAVLGAVIGGAIGNEADRAGQRAAVGAGARAGGAVGNEAGSPGQHAAVGAGALAGGAVGDEAGQRVDADGGYELFVRMDDGRRIVVTRRDVLGIRAGDRVRVSGNSVRLTSTD